MENFIGKKFIFNVRIFSVYSNFLSGRIYCIKKSDTTPISIKSTDYSIILIFDPTERDYYANIKNGYKKITCEITKYDYPYPSFTGKIINE